MIEVMFAIPELDRGGPDRVVYEIVSNLDRARFRPSVLVATSRGHYLERLPADVAVHALAPRSGLRGRYPIVPVLRHVHDRRPRVLFATQRMILTIGAVIPLLPRTTRLVIRQANDLTADIDVLMRQARAKHWLTRRLLLSTFRRAAAVVCQSYAMRDDISRVLGSTERLHVIGNPVDVERVIAEASRSSPVLPGSPALISVGRLARQKGYDLLLRAMARLRERWPQAHLTILGDGPEREALISLAARLGISAAVTFAGFSTDPLPHVRAADVFVLASRYEGFPNAALEALACGVPVVLTNCPGANAEIVSPGVNGWLAAINDESVASALDRVVSNLSSYRREKIQADCSAMFETQRIVGDYEAMLGQVSA